VTATSSSTKTRRTSTQGGRPTSGRRLGTLRAGPAGRDCVVSIEPVFIADVNSSVGTGRAPRWRAAFGRAKPEPWAHERLIALELDYMRRRYPGLLVEENSATAGCNEPAGTSRGKFLEPRAARSREDAAERHATYHAIRLAQRPGQLLIRIAAVVDRRAV
jgi:hypothetical protein